MLLVLINDQALLARRRDIRDKEKPKETKRRGGGVTLEETVQNISPQEFLMSMFFLLAGLELSLAQSCQRWGLLSSLLFSMLSWYVWHFDQRIICT